jgi:hypothetical protein
MRFRKDEIAASEAEISRMTVELDELHHDVGMPALHAALDEWQEDLHSEVPHTTERRTFLLGAAGVLAGGAALIAATTNPGLAAAASKASKTASMSSGSNPPNTRGGIAGLSGDLAVAALAASLENLAVFAYNAGIGAATAGKLGSVPPAVVTFAETAKSQHMDHAAAWNAVLTASKKKAVTVTEPALTPKVQQAFAKVTNATGLAQLALELENVAAQTYQVQSTKLHSKKAIATAATIQPVEMQHAAILYFVLGQYPGIQNASGTPLAFNPTSLAVS